MITLDSIFKKLIESSFKVDLDNPQTDTTTSYLPKIQSENKFVPKPVNLPVFSRPKKDRVFGVFFPFILGLAIALIPFWIYIWRTIKDFNLGV